MKIILTCLMAVLLGAVMSTALFRVSAANAEEVAKADAGIITVTASPDFPEPVDVLEHPGTAISTAQDVKKEMGWLAAIVFVLMTIVVTAAKRAKEGTWLDRGRLPHVLAAAGIILGALGGAVVHEITWVAAMSTSLVALAMLWNPIPVKQPVPAAAPPTA